MNILKPLAQSLVNAALPAAKTEIKARAALLAHDPRFAPAAPVLLPFLDALLDGWTIKL